MSGTDANGVVVEEWPYHNYKYLSKWAFPTGNKGCLMGDLVDGSLGVAGSPSFIPGLWPHRMAVLHLQVFYST